MNTSSSSTTLWATASKEWVIQPKPKPGRKPKKEPVATLKEDIEVDIKGRRFQNRAAQRAFRERKQSQLSELQARIQSYEQGEIERNVALQNIAKRLKDENDQLRQENLALHSKLARILVQSEEQRSEEPLQITDKKRWRDDSPSSTVSLQPSAKKKFRKALDTDDIAISALSVSQLPSPSSLVSTPDSNDTADTQFPSHTYDAPVDLDNNAFDNYAHLSSECKGGNDVLGSFVSFGCGFCDGGTICVCHEITVHDAVNRPIASIEFKNDEINDEQLFMHREDTLKAAAASETDQNSILNNLPAYQPPLPLRRRAVGVPVNSVFPVTAMRDTNPMMEVSCSGDPSNCRACGDDAFGKAFCDAIGNTTLTQKICDNCPNSAAGSQCCSSGLHCTGNCVSASSGLNTLGTIEHDLIPTNAAWQKLKGHPNVDFADLSLLAEVVASRSKCLGPRIVISSVEVQQDPTDAALPFKDAQSYELKQRRDSSPPPRLVPQEILLECGRRRLRHVHADGVREALRLLDAKFS